MSSAGQVVGGIVGGVIGFFAGGNVVYGAQIGMMIGGLLDPPKTKGPRLEDLTAQTSVYGTFIPRLYGTVPVFGNVIWIQGDRLVEHEAEDDGKGGPVVTNFEYFATFAVGLCEGPIDGVRRIWIGGKLWYDAGSDDLSTIIASNEQAALFTLYTGTDTQTADPLIQADRGAANVPAYRGLAYIVFDELPLKDYSNTLAAAQVKVEVVSDGVVAPFMRVESSVVAAAFPINIKIDGVYAYVVSRDDDRLRVFNIADKQNPYLIDSALTGSVPVGVDVSGGYAYVANYNSNNLSIFRLSGASAPVSVSLTAVQNNPTAIFVVENRVYLVNSTNRLQILDVSNPVLPISIGSASTDVNPRGIIVDDNFAYVINNTSGTLQIFDVNQSETPLLVGSVATAVAPKGIYKDGNYVYVTHLTSFLLLVFDVSTPTAPVQVGSIATADAASDVHVSQGYAYVMNNEGTIQAFDVSNPALPALSASLDTGTNTTAIDIADSCAFVLDSYNNTMKMVSLAPNYTTSNLVDLGHIVQSECLQSGTLAAGDLDVSDLTDQVRGYRISSLAPIRGGIDPLRKAWPFDAIQRGYKIKFKKRGGASVATIAEGELDARAAGAEPGVRVSNSREMDLVLPDQLTAQYLDAAREYDVNVAEESR